MTSDPGQNTRIKYRLETAGKDIHLGEDKGRSRRPARAQQLCPRGHGGHNRGDGSLFSTEKSLIV